LPRNYGQSRQCHANFVLASNAEHEYDDRRYQHGILIVGRQQQVNDEIIPVKCRETIAVLFFFLSYAKWFALKELWIRLSLFYLEQERKEY